MTSTHVERQKIELSNYKAPDFKIPSIHLTCELDAQRTVITSEMTVYKTNKNSTHIKLNGVGLECLDCIIDGVSLSSTDYTYDGRILTIPISADSVSLKIVSACCPAENHALEGLYQSGTMLCTQNEPEGFRRITFFLDRPDVLSKFTTTLRGCKKTYPVMLSNGNPSNEKELEDNRHEITWTDPFPKPAYLYAIVAGALEFQQDTFVTKSGRSIDCRIYVEPHHLDRCDHAMESLKKSMTWDEDVYDLEYDLDIFMIVAVDNFNMGAMENKGLNIFNSTCVLAKPTTATDAEYQNIERIIAHEYFHNFTGNRVTCRDWFQLTLKEGLTVFRDQEFTADHHHRAIKRIQDARGLRQYQFAEDASGLAHPIQPSSYLEINNFYTSTIYDKGAEVIRMYQTIMGRTAFIEAVKDYLKTHDGEAATTDDFFNAMQRHTDVDLSQFKRWYHQAGTPVCNIESNYDETQQTLTLTIHQSCRPTPESPNKQPFMIPIQCGLINKNGKEIEFSENSIPSKNTVLISRDDVTKVTLTNVKETPIVSLGRDFSAPIHLHYDYSIEELMILMRHDSNQYNQSEALVQLYIRWIKEWGLSKKAPASDDWKELISHLKSMFTTATSDPDMSAQYLAIPGIAEILDACPSYDISTAWSAAMDLKRWLATSLYDELNATFETLQASNDTSSVSTLAMAQRRLKNGCLSYMTYVNQDAVKRAEKLLGQATTMTEEWAFYRSILNTPLSQPDSVIQSFFDKWKEDSLVMIKWFGSQSGSPYMELSKIKELAKHPNFDDKNANYIRALLGSFMGNIPLFYHNSGEGFEWICQEIMRVDSFNPIMAARLANGFKWYPRLTNNQQTLLTNYLNQLCPAEKRSNNLHEMIQNCISG